VVTFNAKYLEAIAKMKLSHNIVPLHTHCSLVLPLFNIPFDRMKSRLIIIL